MLQEGSLNMPQPEKLTEDQENPYFFPYVFVGDEAFGISVNLMHPYPGNHLTKNQRIFNYRLSIARRFVSLINGESSIGHWTWDVITV